MIKNRGRQQQLRGDKRHAKIIKRKKRKSENEAYLVRLMFKYGTDLKLKSRPLPGEKWLTGYLSE